MRRLSCALVLLLAVASAAHADEIRLKDGSKIVGTIVDFENESFKVQTAYGFAMVRKDSIAQIIPTEQDGPAAKPVSPDTSSAAVKPAAVSAPGPIVKPEAQPAVSLSAKPAEAATATVAAPVQPAVVTTKAAPAKPTLTASAVAMPAPLPRAPAPTALTAVPAAPSSPAPAAAAPPVAVAPAPIRESVQGNLYVNETYNFQFFRPPGWDLMAETRKAMPNAITAMGTSDATTLFIVGREPVRDSLEAQASNAERSLAKVYENYRHVSSTKRIVGGLPAVEWQFRGLADGHDWSVTALTVAHGEDVFTLLGMTYADSDLIQIRENVIARMITSLQFTPAH
jgi:hypothetical protein